jgi:hypothetical protein
MKRFLAISLGALAFFSASCLDRMAGSTSTGNTGKGTISGRVVGADGKGVANARVTVVGADHNPGPGGSGDVDAIVVTEPDGSFRTDSLPQGYYNLLGIKAGQVAFVDSIGVRNDTGSRAGDAALGAPGSVTGVVRLRPGHDSRTVFLILIGTTTFAVPRDSVGNFSLTGLAEGEYRLRLVSVLDNYAPMDTVIKVEAGRAMALSDTLRLTYIGQEGLPLIDRPALDFDPTLLKVRISWKRQDSAKVAAYQVYRREQDSAFVRITPVPIRDTFFTDGAEGGLRAGRNWEYAVTALDARGNEGLKGFPSFLAARARYRIDTIAETGDCMNMPCAYDVDADGGIWILNGDTTVERLSSSGMKTEWSLSQDMSWVSDIRIGSDGGVYVLTAPPLRLVKYDTLGKRRWETPLPDIGDCAQGCSQTDLRLRGSRDSLVIWSGMDRVATWISPEGAVLAQDTVLRNLLPMAGWLDPEFSPETGIFLRDGLGTLSFLDPEGNEISNWSPTAHGAIGEIARDPEGRWYVLWSENRIDVYGPDRMLMETVLLEGSGRRLRYRYGAIYVDVGSSLVRIRTGL